MNNDSISSVVSTLYKIKAEFPYLRIGQIMQNFHLSFAGQGFDTFYMDDEDFCQAFSGYYDYLVRCNK